MKHGDSPLRMPGQASSRSDCHASGSLSVLLGRDSECSSRGLEPLFHASLVRRTELDHQTKLQLTIKNLKDVAERRTNYYDKKVWNPISYEREVQKFFLLSGGPYQITQERGQNVYLVQDKKTHREMQPQEIYFNMLIHAGFASVTNVGLEQRQVFTNKCDCERSLVLATLRFFTEGGYQRGVGQDAFVSLSQTSTGSCIHAVCNAVSTQLERWIVFPTTAAQRDRVQLGSHERDSKPNLPTLGSLPQHKTCVLANYATKAGDSGYAPEPWLLTPITNAARGTPEALYFTLKHIAVEEM
uniref:Uncharacterized protein n=1 Tax=Timema shepardi TaxID=629360 RepID=A0A7R9B246_TIMSH|nr:unnamed protein product [Timema shepardi]